MVVTTEISLEDKIGSIVEMNGLKEVGSSVCYDKATEKGSTVDDNG